MNNDNDDNINHPSNAADDSANDEKRAAENNNLSELNNSVPDVSPPEPGCSNQNDNSDLIMTKEFISGFGKRLTNLEEFCAALLSKMDALENHFVGSLKYDAAKDSLIEKLHRELLEYKDDIILKTRLPLIKELISLYDEIGSRLNVPVAGKEQIDCGDSTKVLDELKESILLSLEKFDVEPFCGESEQFDPKCQQTGKIIYTDDPALNKLIKRSLRPGFKLNGRIIRPESVEVYSFRAAGDNRQPK